MRPLADAWSILIEVTNACRLRCAHCTAGVPHVRRPMFMQLDAIEQALQSLKGWKKGVGCFGGEPTMHPQFAEICGLFRRYFPRKQCALWTCGGRTYEQYRQVIDETFAIVAYNDHESAGFHQPLMIACDEVVPDPVQRRRLIENCWLQHHWSPLITANGAYFCEVAATFDTLFGGPGGHAVEANWWRKDLKDFEDQRERCCNRCSIPLPIQPQPDDLPYDFVSPGNAARLLAAGSPLALRGGLRVIDAVDLASVQTRNPRYFADPGSKHYWTTMTVRSGFWLAAQYRHQPRAVWQFVSDLARFATLKVSHRASRVRSAMGKSSRPGARRRAPPGKRSG